VTVTSRKAVRLAVAQFFGGSTYDSNARAYRGSGPLLSSGLSTVRAYQAKRVSDMDYVIGQAAGRGMGAMMTIEMAETHDNLLTGPGLPAGVHGGQRHLVYPVACNVFHMAHQPYAEDAEADVDDLDQAIHELIYSDPTLGTTSITGPPMIYQAGMSRNGIKSMIDQSEEWKEITATYFRVEFDAEVQIVI
jgi:hypothetical protein